MYASSNHPLIEAMAVRQKDGKRSLLLINKSSLRTQVRLEAKNLTTNSNVSVFYLDGNGTRTSKLAAIGIKNKPLSLPPYSLALLRL